MKAVQIEKYSKSINTKLVELPIPEILDHEVLIQVKATDVNPVDLLNIDGSVRLIQDYKMPVTLGNEGSGIVVKVGSGVKDFKEGDRVYARFPVSKLGSFAQYAAVDHKAIAHMPKGYSFKEAAAIPLTGLTAYQAIVEELHAKKGETLLITGGSGSLGQMAVPIAVSLGLKVIVTGNSRVKEQFESMGVSRYIDYTKENYWQMLSDIDHVIDTLGEREYEHELSVLKKGGSLVSLRMVPNGAFAKKHGLSFIKRALFRLAGSKFDKKAKAQGKYYHFLFVQADGKQLKEITKIVEEKDIHPAIDPKCFSLEQANEALEYVQKARLSGKVVIEVE